jgi:hypothetical protein
MTGGQSRRDLPGICDNLKLYFLIEAIRETYREAGELKFFARLNLAAWRPDLDWRMADRIEPCSPEEAAPSDGGRGGLASKRPPRVTQSSRAGEPLNEKKPRAGIARG